MWKVALQGSEPGLIVCPVTLQRCCLLCRTSYPCSELQSFGWCKGKYQAKMAKRCVNSSAAARLAHA